MEISKHPGSDLIEEEDQNGWIVTYADLMTLLLAFFVLMYAMSSLNVEKFEKVIASVQVHLGDGTPAAGIQDIIQKPGHLKREVSMGDLTRISARKNDILEDIDSIIEEKRLGQHIVTKRVKGKIYIQARGKVLFAPGAAELSKGAKPILDKIAGIIKSYDEYTVNIKGHTDNIPISTAQFASNWELSAIRATSVLKHLIHAGIDPGRLTATGYGDIFPLVPNSNADNRSINRRVEFVLEK